MGFVVVQPKGRKIDDLWSEWTAQNPQLYLPKTFANTWIADHNARYPDQFIGVQHQQFSDATHEDFLKFALPFTKKGHGSARKCVKVWNGMNGQGKQVSERSSRRWLEPYKNTPLEDIPFLNTP